MRTLVRTAIAIVMCVSWYSPTPAMLVFSDTFATNGTLTDTTPDIGGQWQTSSGTTNILTVSSNQLPFTNTSHDARSAFSQSVTHGLGTFIFSGLDLTLSAAQSGDYFFHLGDGGTSAFNQRLFAKSSGSGFQLGIAGGNGTASYGSTILSFNTKYRIAISWTEVSGATNDTFSVYVDPTNSIEANNSAYLSSAAWGGGTATEITSVAAAYVRQGNASNAPTGILDNIRVATTFGEAAGITAVPEPSAALFGALICGVIGLGVGGKRLKNVICSGK